MSEVKRYDCAISTPKRDELEECCLCEAVMDETTIGDYISYDDHIDSITTLQRERDEWEEKEGKLYAKYEELRGNHELLKQERDDLQKALADAQAIVDKLPRTADGVVVVPDRDTVYVCCDNEIKDEVVEDLDGESWGVSFLNKPSSSGFGDLYEFGMDNVYSTREAALEANASSEAANRKGGEESKYKPCDKCGKLTLRDILRCIYRSPFSPVYCPSCYENLYK